MPSPSRQPLPFLQPPHKPTVRQQHHNHTHHILDIFYHAQQIPRSAFGHWTHSPILLYTARTRHRYGTYDSHPSVTTLSRAGQIGQHASGARHKSHRSGSLLATTRTWTAWHGTPIRPTSSARRAAPTEVYACGTYSEAPRSASSPVTWATSPLCRVRQTANWWRAPTTEARFSSGTSPRAVWSSA